MFVCLIYANRMSESTFAQIRLFILTPFNEKRFALHAPFVESIVVPSTHRWRQLFTALPIGSTRATVKQL